MDDFPNPSVAPSAPVGVLQSRTHRFQIGDNVEYRDESVSPPETLTGMVTSFENEEGTYLGVDFDENTHKVLTEDELRRLPPNA